MYASVCPDFQMAYLAPSVFSALTETNFMLHSLELICQLITSLLMEKSVQNRGCCASDVPVG